MSTPKHHLSLIFFWFIIPFSLFAQNSDKVEDYNFLNQGTAANVQVFFNAGIFQDSVIHLVWENYNEKEIKSVIVESSNDGSNFTQCSKTLISSLPDIHLNNYPKEIDYYNTVLMSTEHGNIRYIYNDVTRQTDFKVHPRWYRIKMVTFSGNIYFSQVVSTNESYEKPKDNNQKLSATGENKASSNKANDYTWFPENKGSKSVPCPSIGTPPSGYTSTGQTQNLIGICCSWVETLYQGTSPIMTNCGGDSYAWCCTGLPGASNCPSGYVSDPCCVHYCSDYGECSCTPWECCSSSTVTQWVVTQSTQYTPFTISPAIQDETCAGTHDGSISLTINGTGPFTFVWSGGQQTQSISSLAAGIYTVTVTGPNNCQIAESYTINAIPLPTITGDLNVCVGSTIQLTGSDTPASVNPWVSSTTSVATINNSGLVTGIATGTTTITYTNSIGCSNSITLTVNPIPTSDFTVSPPTSNCVDNTATVSYTGTASSGAIYSWNFAGGNATPGTGQGPHQVSWTSLGSYDITLTVTENNCVSSQTIHTAVVSNLNTNSSTHTNVICYGEYNGTATVNPIDGIIPYSFIWSTTPPQTSQTATNLGIGTYYVTITDHSGCITFDTVQIFQPAALDMNVSFENEGCKNSCDGSVNVSVTGGIPPYQYAWTGSPLHTAVISDLCVGYYSVTATDSNNCTISGSATLITNSPILADATVDSHTVLISTNITFYFTGFGAVDYLWNFGDGATSDVANPSHMYTSEGEYTVLLIVNSGAPDFCIDSMYLTITVVLPSQVKIPNIFTPNGDDANETFKVESVSLETEKMVIYNRWGKNIYSWSEVGGEWNGYNQNGQKEADGVYFYIYDAKGKDGKEYNLNGTITLMR